MKEIVVRGSKKCKSFAYEVSKYYGVLNALYIMGFKNTNKKYVKAINQNSHHHTKGGQGGLGQDYNRTQFLRDFTTTLNEKEALTELVNMFNFFYGVNNFYLKRFSCTGDRISNDEISSGTAWTIPVQFDLFDIYKPLATQIIKETTIKKGDVISIPVEEFPEYKKYILGLTHFVATVDEVHLHPLYGITFSGMIKMGGNCSCMVPDNPKLLEKYKNN